MPGIYFVGVDVGTGSARAALVNAHGRVLQMHVKSIQTWNPQPDHYEQSSEDIWRAVCDCVRVSKRDVLYFLYNLIAINLYFAFSFFRSFSNCSYFQTVTRGYPSYEIAGIGFDATCSLVVLDKNNDPLSVSTTGLWKCRYYEYIRSTIIYYRNQYVIASNTIIVKSACKWGG